MSRQSPSPRAKAYEDFRQKDVQRFTNLSRQAKDHIAGRNADVVDVLCYLSMLRNAGLIQETDSISTIGAKYQATRGSKKQNQEAAHRLPRQILIGDSMVDPSDLLDSLHSRLAFRNRFGDVGVLPRSFNTADKAAEAVSNGLVQALVMSCRHVISGARQAAVREQKNYRAPGTLDLLQRSVWPISFHRVVEGYASWKHGAAAAYQHALVSVMTSSLCISSADVKEEVVAVLDLYLKYNDEAPSRLSLRHCEELEVEFNSVS